MSGAELLAAYNSMTDKPRTSKFENKADAVRRCKILWAQKSGTLTVVDNETKEVELELSKEKEDYPAPRAEMTKSEIRDALVVEILYTGTKDDGGNPHHEGCGAWQAFEILRKCKTRGE